MKRYYDRCKFAFHEIRDILIRFQRNLIFLEISLKNTKIFILKIFRCVDSNILQSRRQNDGTNI